MKVSYEQFRRYILSAVVVVAGGEAIDVDSLGG
jgi:hypothetical protein